MEENEKKQDNHNQHEKYMKHFGNIYESKSRPGRKYYYNVETKEHKWLPCDTQVDIAKFDKNPVQSQQIINETLCSEAKSNQARKVTIESGGSSNTYNKQVINNQVLNQNCHIPLGENEQNMYKPFIFPNTLPVNVPAFPTVNRDVWAVPPATPLIVTPTVTPFLNQQQMLFNPVLIPVNYSNQSHNILTPSISGLTNGLIMVNGELQTVDPKPYKLNYGVNRRHGMHRKFNHKRKTDLRNILSAKESYPDYNMYSNNNNDERTVSCSQKVDDDATTHQNYQEIHKYLETTQQLDLSVIRDLATPNVCMEQWYIVADRIVIQENFTFLNNLIDSDNSCRIMVTESVLTELRTLTEDHNAVKLRRTFRFISEGIKSGRGWIGDHLINTKQNMSIIEICLKLSSEKYHVVLLSSDEGCLKLKNNTEISIFTIQDFKNLVTKSQSVNSPPKRNRLGERIVYFCNNDQQHSIETESKCLEEQSLINQDSGLSKPANANVQMRIVKKSSNVESQNALDIAKVSEDVNSVLDDQKSEMDDVISNADGSSVVNNTNTSTVKYNKRVIKLKQNEGNQKQFHSTKKGWSSRKRTNGGRNTDLTSINNSISTKQINKVKQIRDEPIDITGSKYNVNLVNSIHDTSDCTNVDNSQLSSPLKKKKNNVADDDTASLMSAAENSESENVGKHQQISKCDLNLANIKVMFEITDKSMEEHLSMRSDEWVSRFVQIMEEVLSQVIHQEPLFISEELPPPWILQEATQCIIKKYSHCYYVVDAANNLSIIVHKTSDISGKILMNIHPTEFMKMYSHGMYLVEALMYVCKNCEDLYNARELLKKLLHDIQNHDVDCQNDSFNNPVEAHQRIEESTNIVEESTTEKSVEGPAIHSYERNLHERELNLFEKEDDLETSFFSTLELQKSTCSSLKNSIDTSGKGIVTTIEHDVDKDEPQAKNIPKIVRHFTKCVEYEKRLKDQASKCMLWEAGYNCGIEYGEDTYVGENLESDDDIYGGEDYESENSINAVEDNMKRFRCFIGLFLMEIKKTFTHVHILCKNIVASQCTQSKSDKADLYKKAEKAHMYINKLSKSLEGILNRDVENSDKDIQTLMKKAGVQMSSEQTFNTEYKSIISKCMDQAKEYLSYLNLVTHNIDTIV